MRRQLTVLDLFFVVSCIISPVRTDVYIRRLSELLEKHNRTLKFEEDKDACPPDMQLELKTPFWLRHEVWGFQRKARQMWRVRDSQRTVQFRINCVNVDVRQLRSSLTAFAQSKGALSETEFDMYLGIPGYRQPCVYCTVPVGTVTRTFNFLKKEYELGHRIRVNLPQKLDP